MKTVLSQLKKTKRLLFISSLILVLMFSVVASLVFHPGNASALSGSSFQAGHIIDDGIFTNSQAMSEQDIQNFLNDEVGSCDNNGTDLTSNWNSATNSYYTDGQWSALHGQSSTFTCINQYVENPTTQQNNYGNYTETIPGGISAAQIIYNAAQEYQINPEVILATLQKEQGVVTDYWPWLDEFQYAMGYACPDTSGCNVSYADFYQQVSGAAWQFREYLTYPNNYNYTVGSDYIQYNPSSGCGGSVVNIQNESTAALYDYTPYQPDAAALSNVTGTGDSCSAYGNRNFWYYFNTWFGSSLANGYQATNDGQTAALSLYPGQSGTMTFEFRNTGASTWYDNDSITPGVDPVHLSTSNPVNSNGYFTTGWASPNRPNETFTSVYNSDGVTAASNQHEVLPGQVAVYTFPVDIPANATPGVYMQYVQPIVEGYSYWNMTAEAETNITVLNPNSSRILTVTNNGFLSIQQNSTTNVAVTVENTGESTWYDNDSVTTGNYPLHIATSNPVNSNSAFDNGWPSAARPAVNFSAVYDSDGVTLAPNQHEVTPGEIALYNFSVLAPLTVSPGVYQEIFQPVFDGSQSWDMGSEFALQITVQQSNYAATYYNQSPYPHISIGSTASAFIEYQNTGNATWYDDDSITSGQDAVHLATANPVNRASTTEYDWPSPERPDLTFSAVYDSDGVTLAPNQHEVTPGEIAQFDFQFINNNLTTGQISREYFTPVLDGAPNWSMTSQQVWLDVTGS